MRKRIEVYKLFELIWKYENKNDLWLVVDGKENKSGITTLKFLTLKVPKEFMDYLKVSFKQDEANHKDGPDIPVTPRDKGAPVKSTLTLAKLNTKIDTGLTNLDKKIDLGLTNLDKKVDKGFSDIRTELNKKIDTGLTNLETRLNKRMDDRFDKLTNVIKTLTGIVQEQSKSLQEQSKSIDTINKSVTKLTNDRSR